MYLSHFGLAAFPFGITPDTEFVFSTTAHQEAFNALMVATQNGEGFIKITGEVGTGKTLLCRRYLNAMAGTQAITAYLPNPQLEPRPLLLSLTSPGGKPIQTTADLPGFWRGSWKDVCKDMKGRYPRHRWPDEPWSEDPSLKTKNAFNRSR